MMFATTALLVAATAAPLLHKYDGLVLNADASRIASVEATRAEDEPADGHAAIVIRAANGSIVATIDPCGDCRYAGPAWAPDGRRLAFVGSHAGRATLFVVDVGPARPLATLAGNAAMPRWSPDGLLVSLLVTLDAQKEAGATEPGVRRVGVIDDTHDSRRIAIVDAPPAVTANLVAASPAPASATVKKQATTNPASVTLRPVSSEHLFVYEYDWLPDGRGFVATAADGNGDNNWWIAKLVRFDLDGGMRVLATPTEQINLPRVSPDGREVAYIGGRMSDFGSIGGDVFVVPVDGGLPVDVTPDAKDSFTAIRWAGTAIVGTTVSGGTVGAVTIDPATRKRSATTTFAGSVSSGIGAIGESGSGLASDASGRIVAYASETFESPPHIEYGPLGRTQAITHDNDALAPRTVARSVTWKSEGFDVQGWLLEPTADARSPGRSPMITVVHGGPSAVFTQRYVWDRTISDLLAHGYDVFLPNPRGSYGQGIAFANANYRAFGRGDFRDILAGIDAVERIAPIDDERLGIFGHSYGGFMTMWAVTHSSRFKAAVAGAGVANWVSYYGTNGIDQWMTPFFGKTLYDDPQIYDELSPIRSIKAAKTPTLIYVGERDIEVPPTQSEEFWHGLRALGVPTSLVIYEGEGHRIRTREHIADLNARVIDWFDRYLDEGRSRSQPVAASASKPAM